MTKMRLLPLAVESLAVTALADDIKSARKKVYERVGSIAWQDCFYRKDIGKGF